VPRLSAGSFAEVALEDVVADPVGSVSYQLVLSLTHGVDSQDGGGVIHLGEQAEVLHGGSDRASR
jgi:hypothetical protein